MKIWIALFALCLGAQAQAADSVEMMPATEAQSLVAPTASDANTIAAPISTATEEAVAAPSAMGSMQFRTPAMGTTLVDISYANASATDHMRVYPLSTGSLDPIYIDNNMEANLYSFRFTHGLTDESALFIDGGFIDSKMEFSGAGSGTRKGVRDFEFGYLGRASSGRSAWIYGASIVGSPESANKFSTNAGGFSGNTQIKAHGGYERRLAKALSGVHFALKNEFGSRSYMFYDGQYRAKRDLSADAFGYYEFPIAKKVGFGVSAGLDTDGNPFGSGLNTYHAAAYTAIDVMEDTQLKLQAEGASTTFNSEDSGTTTRFAGVLSKAL